MPAAVQDEPRPSAAGPAAPTARVIDARKVYGRGPSAVTALAGVTAAFPAHAVAPYPDRFRVPGIQPAAQADRGREHHAAGRPGGNPS
jgi:hypothetical protein